MSLVGQVGRRHWRARLALVVIYGLLLLGAITTVYPFLLMASTGVKGLTDQQDNKLIPEFWSNFDGKDEKGKLAEGSLLNKYLMDKYAGDLGAVAATRIGPDADNATVQSYEQFLKDLPLEYWHAGFRAAPNQQTSRLTTMYQSWLKSRFANIDELNKKYIEENIAFQTVTPPSEMLDKRSWVPRKGPKYDEWLEFKASLPAEFRIPIRVDAMYQNFLKAKSQNQFGALSPEVVGTAKTFEEITAPRSGPMWDDFVANALPPRYRERDVETMWSATSTEALPIASFERTYLMANAGAVKSEFSTRNYRYVLDYMVLNGRALVNTVIFCALAILIQLIVNPLAAYALSRYPIRASLKILLFLLATMAFPAEVAMIPSFLLLKDLSLLNTFAALVLPSAASGYMIFLLKGFFDSLPAELFEAGQLDGAREWTMLWNIALPLSRPVLGYLALVAFMGAYGAFMYAFVVCQDQRIWTLMVFIYQLQTVAPRATIMAALTLAAIPTVLVFLAAQKVIMRGIVLPGER